ncbi:MAG: preprotein translocase subunit YajC [Puniceicoccales bacterium]|jgi:preprotein translocase subunit YajC|nr:preprotein translocase subunit YajC [Puniceicoccales bacterium]
MDHLHFMAAATAHNASSGWQVLIMYILLITGMCFLLVFPQRKRQKEQQKMLEGLKAGDKVVTSSGIIGTISNVKGSRFILKISDETKIEIFRSFIQAKLDKSDKSE